MDNASFPYKITISQANVKKNWAMRKEQSFASNYFIFLKILFEFKNLLKNLL